MKKLVLGVSLLGATSLFADYQLTLIDKDGVETNQCIKSYSFSNNLESLARKNSLGLKDVYSEEETLTNKVFMGKPIYRKLINLGIINSKKNFKQHNISNLDRVINSEIIRTSFGYHYNDGGAYWANENAYNFVKFSNNDVIYESSAGTTEKPLIIIMEYTKTTDVANSPSNTFKSYLHYIPSSSTTEELISVDLKDTGVRFLDGYSYDTTTDSCTKN